jgi:hypothetical protein
MNNEEKILQLLEQMNGRLDGMESRLDRLETEVVKTNLTIENEIRPQIKLLAEGQQSILEKLTPSEVIEDHEDRLSVAEGSIRILSREVSKLKKAQ